MLLALVACAPKAIAPPALAPTDPAGGHPHGVAVLAARDAVVRAELPAFSAAIDALAADFPLRGHPEGAQTELLLAIADADAARTEADAAAALGRLAVGCGTCHAATGATFAVPVPSPAPGDGARAGTKRHDRALDLVWSGLVGPSDDALGEGADAFRASTLAPVTGVPPALARLLDDTVNTAAEGMVAVPDPGARAALFGALVSTCAACHGAPPPG